MQEKGSMTSDGCFLLFLMYKHLLEAWTAFIFVCIAHKLTKKLKINGKGSIIPSSLEKGTCRPLT